MSEYVLYDLPSKGRCACWSLNPWKIRMAFNFKGIPYKTEWVEYPDIAPKLKSFGVEPNAEGMPYTIPTVRFSDSEVIMESVKIARALEAKHPEPPLHVDDPIGEEVQKCLTELAMPLFPVMMPQVPRNLLNPSSAEYFRRTREVRFGMPLDEFEKKGGEQSWAAAQAPMEKMAALLKKNGGPFLLGKTVSYHDFVIAGMLQFIRRINQEELFDRFVKAQPVFGAFYKACEPLLARDQ